MTGDAGGDNSTSPVPGGGLEKRIAQLCADDQQIRAAMPKPDVVEAARRPGLRLPQVLQTYVEGYADRPALGWRALTLTTDPTTGRTTSRLLSRFETITYRDLWANVRAAAAAWRLDPDHPVAPGDFVATVGFAAEASTPEVLSEIADLIASGAVDFDVAATYPLDRVADAYEELEQRHTHGKIVLLP